MSDAAAAPTAPSADVKPASEHMNIKVTDPDGHATFFKVKKTTPLRKVMEAFCERKGYNPSHYRFIFDGERIQPDDTPEGLGMEDNDTIDAMVAQVGGALAL